MLVIYKGNSKKLIKNHLYEVQNLYNDGTNPKWLEGKIEINNIRYNVNSFTLENGGNVDKINIKNTDTSEKNTHISFSDLKVGDVLICMTDTLKSLLKDKMYVIENLETIRVNTTPRPYTINYVHFKGISKRFIFRICKFRKLDSSKVREIALESVLTDAEPNYITKIPKRKIDLTDNKYMELMNLLSKSILDKSRHHYSILDWACIQLGKNLSVNKDDFNDILDMKVSDILKLID